MFNILKHRKYGDKKQYKRSLRLALLCWYEWEVLPYFKKLDYIIINGEKNYPLYRWQYPFVKNTDKYAYDKRHKLNNAWYQIISIK